MNFNKIVGMIGTLLDYLPLLTYLPTLQPIGLTISLSNFNHCLIELVKLISLSLYQSFFANILLVLSSISIRPKNKVEYLLA